jgi:CRP-like cAMP-binding protein
VNVAWLPDVASRNQQSRKAGLAGSRLFASECLSAEEKNALESAVISSRKLDTGRDLVRQRNGADSLYLITEGWACRYTITRDGGRHLPALLVPGDIANPDSLLFDRLGYSVCALTAVTVVELSRDRVLELSEEHHGIARAFFWLTLIDNAVLIERALSLSRRSARESLAHLLCELSVRLGADEERPSFAFPMTQEQIADVLGISPVHVNRTLQQLRNDGLVEVKSRTVTVLDAAALRRVAGFQPDYLRFEQNRHDGAPNVGSAVRHAVNFVRQELL